MLTENFKNKNTEPKNGITKVDLVGCGDKVGYGPKNVGDFKFTERLFRTMGLVNVKLVTTQAQEDKICIRACLMQKMLYLIS